MRQFPISPSHPERICWGCEKLCPAHNLVCGNGSERTQHPRELFGDDWVEWMHAQGQLDIPGLDGTQRKS